MARRTHDDALGVTGAETIIGAGVVVHGDLKSESDVSVDGQLEGSISTTADVTIGVNATIKASIEGENITVAGHVTGNIRANGEATIRETGQVDGDITAAGIAINSGGIFVGRSRVVHPDKAKINPSPAD